ncbi:MAG: cytochrome c peroxidase [Bacteroidota bacterium]|nr:cytochrome c peroxidase [Bacteroidota bacterium]
MKEKKLELFVTGLLIIAFSLFSCTKDQLDPNNDKNDLSLKAGVLKGTALTPIEQLGKSLYFDKISVPNSMACADCHAPSVGFTGPMAGINIHGAVYRGADAQSFGDRKPPSAAYATFSPILYYDATEGLFIGGNFWDGRATGERLGSPAAEQALGPFLNPVEHNNPDVFTVLKKIEKAKYIDLWEEVWGEPFSTAVEKWMENYDRVGLAIAAYEASPEVNQFSSKFDYYLQGKVQLTGQEAVGLEVFNGKGMCNLCHISEGERPLFTDFTFDNLGTPKNQKNPVYKYNPGFIDYGLGGFLATRDDYSAYAAENMGKHKVPTLRNVGKKPGKGFTKAYMHNGVFKSLKEVVHFYNTRDVEPWPAPEVAENMNTDELGNLGLTEAEENALVAFMETLSDGYVMKK